MTMSTAAKTVAAIIHFPDDAPLFTLPPKSGKTLRSLVTAIRDIRQAARPEAHADYVERANERVDAAYVLPITRLDEADAMLRLVLASDSEGLDGPVRVALESIGRVLSAAVTSGAM